MDEPEANASCWTKDGYFKTRDAGYTKDGFLFLVTRYSSMAYSDVLKEERAEELTQDPKIGKCYHPKVAWPFLDNMEPNPGAFLIEIPTDEFK